MNITRDVILDLLPLYLDNEVSADTRALVEEYLESDPGLANAARKLALREKLEDVPVPLTPEHQVQAFRKAKRSQYFRNIVLAVLISFAVLSALGIAVTLYAFFIPA